MSDRAIFLLSPYRLPTNHQVLLNEDEMAAWLNGYVAMWHPALLLGATGPPQIGSPYDHDLPTDNQVFVRPESPPLFQPEDWAERVRQAGSIHFTAVAGRAETLANLRQAAEGARQTAPGFAGAETAALLNLPEEQVAPFLAIGFGYAMVESLFDAMEHEHLLAADDFWGDVRQAVAALTGPDGAEQSRKHLTDAANRLLTAREVLYPIGIHLLDVALPDGGAAGFTWPASLAEGVPLNVIAGGQTLEQIAAADPDLVHRLRDKLAADVVPPLLEICGGSYRDREDALMLPESQWWNLRKGRGVTQRLLGAEVKVYARGKSAFHPQTPQWLQAAGLPHALLLNFDSSIIPNHRATVVNWSAPNGKSIDAFTRVPLPADQAQTYFNLVYNLHQSITQDTAPTLALVHRGRPAAPAYRDWLALSRLAPVLGTWTTFGRYFADALAGEYVGSTGADEFFADYLEARVNAGRPDPVSAFARHARARRQLDAAWTLAAMYRGLVAGAPTDADLAAIQQLADREDAVEAEGLDGSPPADGAASDTAAGLAGLTDDWARRLAERLQARSPEDQPGYLVLNPCAFTRRVALELDWPGGPIPVEGPVKAAQFDAGKARLVVEVPPLGFAWCPRQGRPGAAAPRARMRLADAGIVRNEFFEAEVDQATGGLRGIRDPQTRANRVGQQLVFNPGSRMEARSVQVTANGAALGEVTSEGVILDEQNDVLATFRQRFRAWLGRPVLDLRIEIEPRHGPSGYPWHSYYAARFAWRDERAALLRGVNATGTPTSHTRPQSPEYLELRVGRANTVIFPGGLPFHQRQGARMLDVVLIPEGEKATAFDLALALDREHPVQPAVGMVSPAPLVPTAKGPPPVGPSGWLYHLDAPNLLLTSLRPVEREGGARSFVAHLLETTGVHGGSATFRCVRDPVRALLLDGGDAPGAEIAVQGDAVTLDFSASDLLRVRVDFD